jgi:hypothetical protein
MIFALFDPGTDKALESFSVTIGGMAAAVYYLRELFKRKPARPANEQLAQAQTSMDERIARAEGEIAHLWNTMRREDTDIRNQLSRAVGDFERAVGRLEGTIKQVGDVMNALLNQQLK